MTEDVTPKEAATGRKVPGLFR
ncbi:MAG: hypothetical protein QOF61_156, partial [Acidobacteriota bacterium]|nr:hypothetical protein [Acidobacteriota bacterium]